jgi:hypothetical protein
VTPTRAPPHCVASMQAAPQVVPLWRGPTAVSCSCQRGSNVWRLRPKGATLLFIYSSVCRKFIKHYGNSAGWSLCSHILGLEFKPPHHLILFLFLRIVLHVVVCSKTCNPASYWFLASYYFSLLRIWDYGHDFTCPSLFIMKTNWSNPLDWNVDHCTRVCRSWSRI